MEKKPLIERKWLVLIGSTLVLMSLFGVVNNSYQLYIIPVCDDLGFSRTSYTFTQSVCYFGAMISAALSVNVFKRFGVLRTLRASVIILMVLYCCNSLVSSLPLFYIIGFAEGLLMSLSCMVPATMLLKQWFPDKLGFALGLAAMGSGLGGLVFAQVAKLVLISSDWRHLYLVLGLAMGAISIFSAFVLLRENPAAHKAQAPADAAGSPKGVSSAFPVVPTILIFICVIIHSHGNNAMLYTTTPFVQDEGFTLQFAANLSSITMGMFALGKILTGNVIDRIGIRIPTLCSFIAIILGNLGLAFLPQFGMPMLVLMVFGVMIGCPFNSVGVAIMSKYTVSEEHRDRATGIYISSVNFGCALSPVISSAVYDNIGSYVPMYYATAAAVFISMLVIMKVIPGKRQA
ncbi:MAG: MFS transporter [Firmicutes bacterium]|nr:MFS transporter [Bacillota bacterium]